MSINAHAEVIGHVDRSYTLCKIQSTMYRCEPTFYRAGLYVDQSHQCLMQVCDPRDTCQPDKSA